MNRDCPVESLPQDENSVQERREHLTAVWEGIDLSYEEMESKYSWWDAIHTAYEKKIKDNGKV